MDPLLAQCLAAPLDDGPRLVWADTVGGQRGELVVLQCDLARRALSPSESATRRRAQRTLLAAHGRAWAGLDGLASQVRFHRGFVEYAVFASWDIADQLDTIYNAAPLLASLRFDRAASVSELVRFVEHPQFLAIRGLALPLRDTALLATIVEHRAFAGLEALELAIDLPIDTLLDPAAFAHITRFQLRGPDVLLPRFVELMPRLRALDLTHAQDVPRALAAASRELVELAIDARSLPAVVASPVAARLQRLIIRDVDPLTQHALANLRVFPHLRSLALHIQTRHNRQTGKFEETVLGRGFAAAPWPALRELRCDSITLETIQAIGAALGQQLEVLQVPGMRASELAEALPLFAGDLHATPFVGAPPLLLGGDWPNAPLWDYPRVNLLGGAPPDV